MRHLNQYLDDMLGLQRMSLSGSKYVGKDPESLDFWSKNLYHVHLGVVKNRFLGLIINLFNEKFWRLRLRCWLFNAIPSKIPCYLTVTQGYMTKYWEHPLLV